MDSVIVRSEVHGNEFLAEVMREAGRRLVRKFTWYDVAGWFQGKYTAKFVKKKLSWLASRGRLHAEARHRWLRAGYFRGSENVYEFTQHGRNRASWYEENHNLASIAYLGSTPAQGSEFASGVRLKMASEFSPRFSNGASMFSFRSRDRNNLGALFSSMSGNSAYLISFPRSDPYWWIELMKREGTMPAHLASPMFILTARQLFGASRDETLFAIMYRALQFRKTQVETLERKQKEAESREKEADSRALSFIQDYQAQFRLAMKLVDAQLQASRRTLVYQT